MKTLPAARAHGQRGDEMLVLAARLTAAHGESLDELVTLQGKSTPPIYYSPQSQAGTLIIFKSDVAAMGEHTRLQAVCLCTCGVFADGACLIP